MRPSTLALCLSLLAAPASAQERVADPVPESAPRTAEIVADLERAKAALSAWRAELAAGAGADAAQVQRVRAALKSLGTEVQAVAELAQASAERARLAGGTAEPAQPTQAERELEQRAWALSKVWVDDGRALGEGSSERRARALEEIRAALGSDDAVGNLAALRALQQLGDVEYDKAAFRPLVLSFAREARGPTLPVALYGLVATVKQPADIELVYAGWERDPGAMRESVVHLMFALGGSDLKGRSEEIALELLSDESDPRRAGFNGMWGARVGPALEARVLELARSDDRGLRHDAIYFGLSTFEDKSAAVVEELIAVLADPDINNSRRALWGLSHGVPEAQQARVVEALIGLHAARSDRSTREDCERIVREYGGEQALARLAR